MNGHNLVCKVIHPVGPARCWIHQMVLFRIGRYRAAISWISRSFMASSISNGSPFYFAAKNFFSSNRLIHRIDLLFNYTLHLPSDALRRRSQATFSRLPFHASRPVLLFPSICAIP